MKSKWSRGLIICNIILKLYTIQKRTISGGELKIAIASTDRVAMVLFEHDLNEIFTKFCRQIRNAGNKSGRRSPESFYAEEFNLRNIRGENGLIAETGTSDNCVGRIEGKFSDFPETIGRAYSPSLSHDLRRNPCGPYYVVLLLATQMLQ